MPRSPTPTRSPIRQVTVVRTGSAAGHPEHLYGTRKPTLWWVFTSRHWLTRPINVYVIEHEAGIVLFDTGMDPAVVTDPGYWPDPITRLIMGRVFRWKIGPEDTLGRRLAAAGYPPGEVSKAVLSHLHMDHAGGIRDIPQAELYVAPEAWDHMKGPHPEREAVLRRDILVLGARWRPLVFEPTDDPVLAPFGEACDLMGDGSLQVVPTPGHLPGSVSMLVRSAGMDPLLLVGDLTYAPELLERDQVPGTGDAAVLRRSFARVRALRELLPDLAILPAHDPGAEDRLCRARASTPG